MDQLAPAELQPNTAPVTILVTGLEAGAGAVVALAIVDIEVAGIAWQVQGVRVVKRDGLLIVQPPQWRHPRTGVHIPAVGLPPELASAISDAVLEALQTRPPGRA